MNTPLHNDLLIYNDEDFNFSRNKIRLSCEDSNPLKTTEKSEEKNINSIENSNIPFKKDILEAFGSVELNEIIEMLNKKKKISNSHEKIKIKEKTDCCNCNIF